MVTQAVRRWLGARRERAERDAELVDLVRLSVRDRFQQRKLVRQLEDLADQIAERLRPVYEHDFRTVAENERVAALLAVVDTLFAVDVDARKLARQHVPVRRVGLAEPAERLYNAVLDESCMALVQVVKHLPAFEPRALTELLGRFSQVIEGIGEVLHRLPRTTRNAPAGREHDEESGSGKTTLLQWLAVTAAPTSLARHTNQAATPGHYHRHRHPKLCEIWILGAEFARVALNIPAGSLPI